MEQIKKTKDFLRFPTSEEDLLQFPIPQKEKELEEKLANLKDLIFKQLGRINLEYIGNLVSKSPKIPQDYKNYWNNVLGTSKHENCETVLQKYQETTYHVTMETVEQVLGEFLDGGTG